MRKMKDSGIEWIGDIPEDWKIKKLKFIVKISDGTHDTPLYVNQSDNSYPLVTSKCIINEKIDINLAKHISKNDYDKINLRSKVEIYDVIMPMIGTVGNPALIIDDIKFAIKNVALIRTNKSYYLGKLITYLLSSNIAKTQFNILDLGGVQNFISQEKLKNMIFPMCNNVNKIVDYLDKKCSAIDSTITKEKKLIEKLKEYKQSLITETVTKGLNSDVPMKDSGVEWIGDIPENSQLIQLKYLCQIPITDGTHNTPEYDDSSTGCPFLSSKDIKEGKIHWENIKYITSELHKILQKEVSPQRDDILLAKNGTTGVAALVDTDKNFDVYVTLAVIRPNKKKILPRYLLHVINSFISKKQFDEHLIGIGVPNLHLNVINNTKIIIYNPLEQQKIADYLDEKCSKIDENISKRQALIEKLTEYKKSLIYEVVTGKTEV